MNPYFRELSAKGRAVEEAMTTAAQLSRETREHNVELEAALGAVIRAEAAAQKAAKRLKTELSADPSTAHDSQTNTFISSASIQQQATQQLRQQQQMQAGGHYYQPEHSPAAGRRIL